MIVQFSELWRLRGTVAMVDGCFDPLHKGHIDYFRAAAEAASMPLLCNLASDEYVRTKHPPFLPEEQRVAVIDAIRYIAYTHVNRTNSAEVLRELRPRYFIKGADWRSRLPPEEVAAADEMGIQILYVDTVFDSSTRILDRFVRAADALRQPT